MKCIVCGKDKNKVKFIKNNYQLVKCKFCGLLKVDPLPTLQVLQDFYNLRSKKGNYSPEKNKETYKVDEGLADYIEFFSIKDKKIFDIGCFNGQLLDILKERGWETWGLEFQGPASERARINHGRQIYTGAIEDLNIEDLKEKFDVVTAMGLIEHTLNPSLLTQKIGFMLKKGGFVFIQTPNYDSLISKLFGKYWPPLAPPEHLYYFSPENPSRIFSREGIQLVKWRPHWKKLRIGYVLDQLNHFGIEIASITNRIRNFIPQKIQDYELPFYGGEIIWVGRKVSN
jgi:2-polyprenyl-3-methyl-5-hydroxy-6-metoxy-1,4-benzoquinol methylase